MAVIRQQMEFPIRPSNKELEWFEQYDDLFDQYIDSDLLQLSDNAIEPSSSDDASNFFNLSGSSNQSDHTDTSPMPNQDIENTESEDSWQAALRYLERNATSPVLQGRRTSVYPESHGKAAASEPEIFSLDLQVAAPASSTPVSPSPFSPRNKEKLSSTLTNVCFRQKPTGVRKPSRTSSVSPKMMDGSRYRNGYQGTWAKRMEAAANRYNLQFPVHGKPASPPPSSDLTQGDFKFCSSNGFDPLHNMAALEDDLVSPMTNTFSYPPQLSDTPIHSPTLFDSNSQRMPYQQTFPIIDGFLQTQTVGQALSALQTPPQTQQLPTGAWRHNATSPLDFTFPASPDFQSNHKAEAWWTPTSAAQPTSPTYQGAQPNMMALDLDRTAPTDLATTGLMISYEPSDLIGGLSNTAQAPAFVASPQPYAHSRSYTTSAIPNGLPNQQDSFSRTPSSSPPPITPTRTRRASSKPRTSHHRRKSSSGNNGSARPASVGFVNFTPDDSRKILTGVAPSGSSKTKARREKEAAEKRRKLSEAAKRAVIEAGGDLKTLEKEGLLALVQDS